jgi:intracellular sulfur oxidation DsrE/DsrF family protein
MNGRMTRIAGFTAVLLSTVLLVGLWTATAVAGGGKRHKVVYHLNEADVNKTKFALSNMQNHIKGTPGGADALDIQAVIHGPALKHFARGGIDPKVKATYEELLTQGVQFNACGNTIKAFHLPLSNLLEGMQEVPEGGVVRIMRLQQEGYVYIRP